ncbi:hypothetical protein [Neisseria sp. Ec49-e6-T10]|uniref:hypothetical protein n=1 Tax=Neisseria sp. Ec49-e6-T10 TaxID=3140744 RepID=UPI003EB74140
MIRNGTYTLYKKKEYRIGESNFENQPIRYWLKSMDPVDMENGFHVYERPKVIVINGIEYELPDRDKNKPKIYVKDITSSEIDEVYYVNTYAIYHGEKCSVEGEDSKHYFLRVEQRSIADKLNFDIRDRDDFVKTVAKQDVEKIFEEKTPMPNYFK